MQLPKVVYIDAFGGRYGDFRPSYAFGDDQNGDGTPQKPFLTKERALKELSDDIGCVRTTQSQLICFNPPI
jgi:hypothetical protein